jgi:DNA-binding transcriptional LysR family regulator
MELRQLRYFVSLAEHLHFGRAAAAAFISQSALSQQIQKLERDLGAQLFVRQVGNVSLTPAGHALLPRARQTLRHSALCYAGVAEKAAEKEALIRLSYPASAANVIARMGLAEFANAWPGTTFDLTESATCEALLHLAQGDADVAFTWLPVPAAPAAMESLTIYSVESQVVVSATHPLASRPSLDWEDLSGETQILFERSLNPALYDTLRSPFRQLDVKSFHVSPMSVNFFASIGTGFSISCAEVDATLVDNPAVRVLPVRRAPLRMQMAAHYGCAKVTPTVRRFISFLHGRFVHQRPPSLPRPPQRGAPGLAASTGCQAV